MDLFNLIAKLTLDSSEYNRGLKNAENEGTGFLESFSTAILKTEKKLKSVKSFLQPIFDVVEDIMEVQEEYQQITGNVEAKFGKTTDKIVKNARTAFKTAGISITSYLGKVTDMSSLLLTSVGDNVEEAADLANQAILQMADNAAAFGKTTDQVADIYNKLSNGRYTALRDLRLGYGGTKDEMQRLLDDAAEYAKEKYGLDLQFDMSNYADIIRAIGYVQEKAGIVGSAKQESTQTVAGSKAAIEAAKENMQILMADPNATKEERDEAAREYADAIGKYVENLIPVITSILQSLLQSGAELFPELAKVIGEMLPPWLQSGLELIGQMISSIFSVVQAIAQGVLNLPDFFKGSLAAYVAEYGWVEGNRIYDELERSGRAGMTVEQYKEWKKQYDEWYESGGKYQLQTEEERAATKANNNQNAAEMVVEKVTEVGGTIDDFNEALELLAQGLEMNAQEAGNKVSAEVVKTLSNNMYFEENGKYYRRVQVPDVSGKVEVRIEEFDDIESAIASIYQMLVSIGRLDLVPSQYGPWKWEATPGSNAKGLWEVPYNDYLARLHRGEMVLTASQAREYRGGNMNDTGAVVAAIGRLSNEMQNLKIVVGEKVFGKTVVDYSGKRMSGYLDRAENKAIAGYGWG